MELEEDFAELPQMIRQASENAERSHLECFCTDLIVCKAGNLRLRCNCLVHYECLVRYIRSKSSEEMRYLQGVHCPYHKAGLCENPTRGLITTDIMETMIDDVNAAVDGVTHATSDMLEKKDVEKYRRWMTEPSFLDLKDNGEDTVNMGKAAGPGADQTDAFITATTKPCPVCSYRGTHFHGHSCHHTVDGCPSCHTQYCYKCLATEADNVKYRGQRPKCLCGGWSNFCKSTDILENLVLVPYPHDKRCGCPICPECRPGKRCDFCFGDCVVCRNMILPGPVELGPDGTCSSWVPQSEEQIEFMRRNPQGSHLGRVFIPVAPGPRVAASPLFSAIQNLDTATALLLISNNGTQVNDTNRLGQTPLIMAVLTGNRRVVQALLARRDININACDNNGRTALIRAAIGQNEIILQMLLERSDLNINAADNWGFTALNCAAQRGYYGPCEWLLAREDIDINATDSNRHTALYYAITRGHEDLARILTGFGAVAESDTREPLVYKRQPWVGCRVRYFQGGEGVVTAMHANFTFTIRLDRSETTLNELRIDQISVIEEEEVPKIDASSDASSASRGTCLVS